jgi:hypothetical protein
MRFGSLRFSGSSRVHVRDFTGWLLMTLLLFSAYFDNSEVRSPNSMIQRVDQDWHWINDSGAFFSIARTSNPTRTLRLSVPPAPSLVTFLLARVNVANSGRRRR